jgi:hypothetical protein
VLISDPLPPPGEMKSTRENIAAAATVGWVPLEHQRAANGADAAAEAAAEAAAAVAEALAAAAAGGAVRSAAAVVAVVSEGDESPTATEI